MNDKPWLVLDEHACEIIANKKGLRELREKLDTAISSNLPELELDVDGVAVEKIILLEKEVYEEQFREYEETWVDKLFAVVAILWFIVLPVIALILIVKLFL